MHPSIQTYIPQHLLSRAVGKLAACKIPAIKNALIAAFIKQYNVEMSEAEISDYTQFESFNAFFTRALKGGKRPLPEGDHVLVSPADGVISQCGDIVGSKLLQAKGHDYTLDCLLGSERLAREFDGGQFMTVYLSPRDYHRVHMPLTGQLIEMVYIPGKLYSVNEQTAGSIPNLFAKNERVVCVFETEVGPMAVVLVGAMIVASIETVWHGLVAPARGGVVQTWDYEDQAITLERGEEMGRFLLGSTAIVVFPENTVSIDPAFSAGSSVRVREAVGSLLEADT